VIVNDVAQTVSQSHTVKKCRLWLPFCRITCSWWKLSNSEHK